MTAPSFPDGIDAEVWEEVDEPTWRAAVGSKKRTGIYIEDYDQVPPLWLLRREPTPTMPVLPSEAAFVASACGCTDSYCAAREGARRAYRFSFEGDE